MKVILNNLNNPLFTIQTSRLQCVDKKMLTEKNTSSYFCQNSKIIGLYEYIYIHIFFLKLYLLQIAPYKHIVIITNIFPPLFLFDLLFCSCDVIL